MDVKQKAEFEIKREQAEYSSVPEPDTSLKICKKWYECEFCSYRTLVKGDLRRHYLKHGPENSYECKQCSYTTVYKKVFENHNLKCKICNQQQYFCGRCSYSTKTKRLLINHVKTHSTCIDYTATNSSQQGENVKIKQEEITVKEEYMPECTSNLMPITEIYLKTDVLSKEQYTCEHCSYRTPFKLYFTKHLGRHGLQNSYECKHCGYQTVFEKFFEKHELNCKILNQHKYFCAHCSYSAKSKPLLRTHLRIHSTWKPFVCEICDYKVTKKESLERHMLVHTGEKQLLVHPDEKYHHCKQCDYKTVNRHHLKRHQLVHTNEKPFHCKQCEYKTTNTSNLKRHLLVHTGDAPFRCQICEETFDCRLNLRCHVRNHIGKERLFYCAQCSFQTTVKYTLRCHMVTHRDERPFACSLCPYRAKLMKILTHHKKTIHSIKYS